jgi:hypothetical protein
MVKLKTVSKSSIMRQLCLKTILLPILLLCRITHFSTAFAPKPLPKTQLIRPRFARNDRKKEHVDPSVDSVPEYSSWNHRRTLVGSVATALLVGLTPGTALADTGAEVRGTKLNAFNGLIFQYRGNDFPGLSAADIDEPSISYAEFVTQLKAGEVTSVDFLAPDGDVAYATLRSKGKLRIGEGYPIEQHDGYSSPAFAIRTVKNAGVPYKFIVPALSQAR